MTDDIIKALSVSYTIIGIIGIVRILWLIDPLLGFLAIMILAVIVTRAFIFNDPKNKK